MVFIKISGTTNRKDAEAVSEIADMMSIEIGDQKTNSRALDLNTAHEISEGITVKKVVACNTKNCLETSNLIDHLQPNFLEVFDSLEPKELAGLKDKVKVIKGFTLTKKSFEDVLAEIEEYDGCYDTVLLDTGHGPAMKKNWLTAARVRDELYPTKIMINGGLTPDNVAKAIKRIRPWAVDVNAGVERKPGKKSFEKMRHFSKVVRRFTYKY